MTRNNRKDEITNVWNSKHDSILNEHFKRSLKIDDDDELVED